MSKPLVAIVGRPNVGKSTLINGLAQRRVSIVEDIPGVTRDRIYCDVKWLDKEFTLIDTGALNSGMRRTRFPAAFASRRSWPWKRLMSFCSW